MIQQNDQNNENPLYLTNSVFYESEGKDKMTYYIPGYLRLKVKNFTSMDLQNLDAQVNAAIIFTIYYGDIPDNIADKLASKFILLFGRDDAIKLSDEDQNLETKVNKKKDKKQIQFTLRKLFHLRIQSQVFWSPFQIINLILSVTVQPVTIQNTVIKVNLMDHPDSYLKLSYTEQGSFGEYNMAQTLTTTKYSNNRVYKISRKKEEEKIINKYIKFQEESKKNKIQHFQYAHFNVPLFKFPIVSVATIFLPLWLLAIVNLGIFFQSQTLANRVQSIASLMIAFVAFIPVIREQIPPNPKIVFIEMLVYLQTLTSLFALIHSLDVRNIVGFQLIWYDSGLFMVSFIITIITMIIVLVLMLVHYFVWAPSYKRKKEDITNVSFKREEWFNEECDQYFESVNKIKKLTFLKDPKLINKKSSQRD